MPKYKISKSYLKEFFGLFGRKNKPKDIEDIINNDPVLQRLSKEAGDIHRKARARLEKENPELLKLIDKYE